MWDLTWQENGYKVPYIICILFPLAYIPLFLKLVACIPGLWRFPILSCFFRNSKDRIPCYVMARNVDKLDKPKKGAGEAGEIPLRSANRSDSAKA